MIISHLGCTLLLPPWLTRSRSSMHIDLGTDEGERCFKRVWIPHFWRSPLGKKVPTVSQNQSVRPDIPWIS